MAVAARWLVGTERVPALLVAANHAWQLLTGGGLCLVVAACIGRRR